MENLPYTTHKAELATRLRRLREARGYSTRMFAAMIGVSRTHLYNIEHGSASPTFEMLERFCAGLDIPVDVVADFRSDRFDIDYLG